MTKALIGRAACAAVLAAGTMLAATTPAVSQSKFVVCQQGAIAICNQSIEGYETYAQCVIAERQSCLDGFPGGELRITGKPNDYEVK